jgi:type VI secretion system protein ImpM
MLNLSFQRTESVFEPAHVLCGKLPSRPDFIRVNANHPVARELDSRIQSMLERNSGDMSLREAFGRAAPVDYCYVSQDRRHVMVGVLVPSQDSAGRLYPFISGLVLPNERFGEYLPVLPIAYEVFTDGLRDQAVNAVRNSVEALSCRQFLERSLQALHSGDDDFQLAASVVQRFLEQTPCGRMADLVVAEGGLSSLHQPLLNIAFYMDYLRRFDSRVTNQVIVLPLPESGGDQALLASAWLSLLSALMPSSPMEGPWSCSHLVVSAREGLSSLVISVGSISDSFVSVMLGGCVGPGVPLDLAGEQDAWKSHRMYAEASYALGRVLADPDFRVASLCRFLEDMSRQLEMKR